jgi:hypothetical protein
LKNGCLCPTIVEPACGQSKDAHGLRKFLPRGYEKVQG